MEVKKENNGNSKVEGNGNAELNLKSKKEKHYKWKENKGKLIIIILLVTIIIISMFLAFIVFGSKSARLKVLAESSLEKIVEKNNLETVEYTYNAIAKQCKKEGCSKDSQNNDDFKYFALYYGTVTAGIDFKQVKIDVNESEKKLVITVPEPMVTGYNVDIGSIKLIFSKDKYNEASEFEKILKLCKEDLKNRSEEDKFILETAKQNSITVLEAFFEPWIEAFDDKYNVEIK